MRATRPVLPRKPCSGEGSHLPLYKPEGLVDAFRRDADASFLCYAVPWLECFLMCTSGKRSLFELELLASVAYLKVSIESQPQQATG